ncbi:hypothetical protein ES703_01242 [subsurface metagenome]
MVTEKAVVIEEEKGGVLAKATRPMLTETAIQAITYDLKMAERLVTEALEVDVDYGQIPGVSGKGLWDPGASKIMNAFECYPRHKILYHEETDTLITWAIEAEIIHRGSQLIIGSGVGACSTREPKYKYRWVSKEEAQRLGYTVPEIDRMKTKKRKFYQDGKPVADVVEYRVENPEYGEQVNTIMQMAAKRAETDGAKTLPGVSSALRKLFQGASPAKSRGEKHKDDDSDENSPRWTTFWNSARGLLGDDYQEKVHHLLGVKSMKDWLKSGKSLEDAIRVISQKLTEQPPRRDPTTVKEAEVKTADDLCSVMAACFGWPEVRVWAEANFRDKKNFEEAGVETPWAVFQRLCAFIKQQSRTE